MRWITGGLRSRPARIPSLGMPIATKKKPARSAARRRVKASPSYGIAPRPLPKNCATVGDSRAKGAFAIGADLAVVETAFASRNL